MTFPDPTLTEQQRQLQFAHTCNEVAAILFPDAAQSSTAFLEATENPLDMFPQTRLVDWVDDFWARTLAHTVYATSESQFLQYSPCTGLYAPITETTLIGQLITNLNTCAQHLRGNQKPDLFALLKNQRRLRAVVERAKHLLAQDPEKFFRPESKFTINLGNGVLNLLNRQFLPYSPEVHARYKMPVNYDPEAKCDLFVSGFLERILELDDIEALQMFSSQMLQGSNEAQKLMILTGESGWGKSTLMKVFGALLSYERVGIIREQVFSHGNELAHYAHKNLLYCPDMQSQFLNRKEATLFKQLVGGDPIWAESKDGNGRIIIEGNFPVVLACNGKPRILIDQDVEAWARRLVVLNFKKPDRDKHIGKLIDLFIHKELPGILNWMLDGFEKLKKSSFQLTLTQEQRAKTMTLLLASESPQAYVRSALVKKSGAVMGSTELYENYQSWCREHHLQPFAAMKFYQSAKAELETALGLKYRHDLPSETGGFMRGWKGLALIETDEVQNVKKASEVSGEEMTLAG